MEKSCRNGDPIESQIELNISNAEYANETNNSAGEICGFDAEQVEFDAALAAIGLDPKTVPRLALLRAPRVEPAPRQSRESATERSFQALTAEEWKLFRRVIEATIERVSIDWARKRRHWTAWLYKVAADLPWTRLPARFGSHDGARKSYEAAAQTGQIERVCDTLLDCPAISADRKVQLQALANRARATRERVESYRATGAKAAVHGKPAGPA